MKYKGRRQSSNVDDRRFSSGGAAGLGGVGLIIAVIYALLTQDIGLLFNVGMQSLASKNVNTQYVETVEEKELAEFVSVVLADTEEVWSSVFKKYNMTYQEPKMVLFNGRVSTGCGSATNRVAKK